MFFTCLENLKIAGKFFLSKFPQSWCKKKGDEIYSEQCQVTFYVFGLIESIHAIPILNFGVSSCK